MHLLKQERFVHAPFWKERHAFEAVWIGKRHQLGLKGTETENNKMKWRYRGSFSLSKGCLLEGRCSDKLGERTGPPSPQ